MGTRYQKGDIVWWSKGDGLFSVVDILHPDASSPTYILGQDYVSPDWTPDHWSVERAKASDLKQPRSIPKAFEAVITEKMKVFRDRHDTLCGCDDDPPSTAKEMNSGHCMQFAHFVTNFLPPETNHIGFVEFAAQNGGPDHIWIEYRGRHYDAERPRGVDDWRELPIFDTYPDRLLAQAELDDGEVISRNPDDRYRISR